ncbi:hypothetical protein H0H81_006878 [Sphagnurus paluster]|uniref:Uncharacterized protein n=1 Tax=Sphagnurus paluster TaxID=117069 RepID=A0A9P7GKZ0_9AGAR|nr:hypothetical protein H0H81_006878 [Sphagnurus paluster]
MALAQQLAELALANSQGLLNDDEYRLLRHNLFEVHSNSALIPVEAPILHVASPGRKPSVSSVAPPRTVDIHVDVAPPRVPALRHKNSFASGVTNLLRRATGHKPTPLTPPPDPPKRGVIPRVLHRKASELFSHRVDGKTTPNTPATSPRIPHRKPSDLFLGLTESTSRPSQSPLYPESPHGLARQVSNAAARSPKRISPTADASSEIFDDHNLHTAKDIRAAIAATEIEAQHLRQAFDGLESTTTYRVYQQHARRLPAATPEHVTALIDGTDWRHHRPRGPPHPHTPPSHSPSPSLSPRPLSLAHSENSRKRRHRHVPSGVDSPIDSASLHSDSSNRTSISRSRSISSLRSRIPHLTSPLSPRPPQTSSASSMRRKNSVSSSSINSQSASYRFGVTTPSSLSRSTGHLPLRVLAEGDDADEADVYTHPEVTEIQQRRDEVMARYVARIEYLQARLKSAELHEKLLRR